jgi:uncharacterized protein (DUF2062 family)
MQACRAWANNHHPFATHNRPFAARKGKIDEHCAQTNADLPDRLGYQYPRCIGEPDPAEEILTVSDIWRQTRAFLYRRVLHADDTPRSIAGGVAIATFVAFLPIMGIQTVVALALAALARANKAVCIPVVWITNPFTAVPIYASCWWVGRLVLTGRPGGDASSIAIPATTPPEYAGFGFFAHMHEAAFWKYLFSTVLNIGAELWTGSVIIGGLAAALVYPWVHWGVTEYRRRRAARQQRRRARVREAVAAARALPHSPTKSACAK